MSLLLDVPFTMDKPVVVIIVAIIIAIVIAQSVFFLFKAIKQAKSMGIKKSVIRNTIQGSALFTIAPAIAILIGVVVLIGALGGYALPWLRLSVIGALTYELTSAASVMKALEVNIISNASQYITVALVMTIGIIIGLILVPFVCKPISNRIDQMKKRNTEWTDILVSAMFVGMISAFLGYIFSDVLSGAPGWIPVIIMAISALVMIIIGVIIKVTKWKVLENYAIPISMVISMLCALPITELLTR